MRLSSLEDGLSDIGAQRVNLRPGTAGFEGLGHYVVQHAEVSDVGDHVRQLVALDAILGSARQATVLLRDFSDLLHLQLDHILRAFN